MKFKIKLAFTFGFVYLFFYAIFLFSAHSGDNVKFKEADYRDFFCKQWNGQAEYVLSDKTRVDCLTEDSAIEIDWNYKWHEGLGQALYYAKMTGKRAEVALIIPEGKSIMPYYERLIDTIIFYELPVDIRLIYEWQLRGGR